MISAHATGADRLGQLRTELLRDEASNGRDHERGAELVHVVAVVRQPEPQRELEQRCQ